jgi:hypothetical protein
VSATIYDEVKVTISLGDLFMIHSAANCFQIAGEKREALEKKNAELLKECERQAEVIDQLRFSISDAKYELDAWKKAEKVEKPIVDALAYLDEHNTPFENFDVDTACAVIRALLAKKSAAPVETPAAPASMEEAI